MWYFENSIPACLNIYPHHYFPSDSRPARTAQYSNSFPLSEGGRRGREAVDEARLGTVPHHTPNKQSLHVVLHPSIRPSAMLRSTGGCGSASLHLHEHDSYLRLDLIVSCLNMFGIYWIFLFIMMNNMKSHARHNKYRCVYVQHLLR